MDVFSGCSRIVFLGCLEGCVDSNNGCVRRGVWIARVFRGVCGCVLRGVCG